MYHHAFSRLLTTLAAFCAMSFYVNIFAAKKQTNRSSTVLISQRITDYAQMNIGLFPCVHSVILLPGKIKFEIVSLYTSLHTIIGKTL